MNKAGINAEVLYLDDDSKTNHLVEKLKGIIFLDVERQTINVS